MVTSSLKGGLGNVMFQIATAYSYAIDNNYDCKFNLNSNIVCCTKHFENLSKYKNNIFHNVPHSDNIRTTKHFFEPFFNYNKIECGDDVYLDGYFQSFKYFQHNRKHILHLFQLDEKSNNYIQQKYDDIFSQKTVGIHIRRNDYLKYTNIHPNLNKEYYNNGMDILGDYKKVIASDDIEWCKRTFNDSIYLNEEDYIDMHILSKCTHNIIANSTFSWWAAWLNNNQDKKIICPKEWFTKDQYEYSSKDICCDEWIKI